jgi:hypothetical protein
MATTYDAIIIATGQAGPNLSLKRPPRTWLGSDLQMTQRILNPRDLSRNES